MYKIKPVEFFDILYKHCQWGKVEFNCPAMGAQVIHPVTNLNKSTLKFPKKSEVYFRPVTYDGKGRREENIVEIPVLWLDMYTATKKSRDIATQKMDIFQLEPTLQVVSGDSIQYYWVFNVPLKSDQIEKVKEALKKFATYFGGTMDLSISDRFMRAPDKLSQAFMADELRYSVLLQFS
jgi:hypothetical protein